MAKKYIDAEEITPIMAEYVADVFSRKEHLDDISYGYCMEIADVFRRYAERAKQEQPEVDIDDEIDRVIADYSFTKTIDSGGFKTTVLDYVKIARHFYELGLNARKEE